MEKEDNGLGASFFAKGMEEAMISVGMYYADRSRKFDSGIC